MWSTDMSGDILLKEDTSGVVLSGVVLSDDVSEEVLKEDMSGLMLSDDESEEDWLMGDISG